MIQCRGCGQAWTARKACHCTACHQTFSSETSFTAHQSVEGCEDPLNALDKNGNPRFALTGWGVWTRWRPDDDSWRPRKALLGHGEDA